MGKFHKSLIRFLLAISFVLPFAMVVTACDITPTATAKPQKSVTATASPSPTASSAQINCGNITQSVRGFITSKDDPQKVGDCFWNAFQQCKSASLDFNTIGVDTIMTRTFRLQKTGASCQIVERAQNRVLPQKPRVLGSYTCASVEKTATSLQFIRCQSEGTIKVPLSK